MFIVICLIFFFFSARFCLLGAASYSGKEMNKFKHHACMVFAAGLAAAEIPFSVQRPFAGGWIVVAAVEIAVVAVGRLHALKRHIIVVERLEEFDDVQTVYTNMKPEEEVE